MRKTGTEVPAEYFDYDILCRRKSTSVSFTVAGAQ